MRKLYSKIVASGSFIPLRIIKNSDFLKNNFIDNILEKSNEEIISKFYEITGISERRYVFSNQTCSEIGFLAAKDALNSSSVEKEEIDCIIVAHNFGDVFHQAVDIVPSIACRIKHLLGIENENCIAYDLIFGCPGWVQGLIQANYLLQSGDAKRIMVIGTETLSKVINTEEKDCMIFSDGAGAVILESTYSEFPVGILSHVAKSFTINEYNYIRTLEDKNSNLKIKMEGRKVYEFALKHVPLAVKECLDKAQIDIDGVKKILIHQANEKMDNAILNRILRLYGYNEVPNDIMPMTISNLGNNSVATIPIMLDLMLKNLCIEHEFEDHAISKGDIIVFASVGAGMNINSIVYKVD
ncbi:MAG: ketoacyl-ACP synthase III [Flavobacteriia bacterium]|nr:ketoacyl-ACP synthase III [Flavobacteriia bacterium]